MIIIPASSPEAVRAQAEWISRQPVWVQRIFLVACGALILGGLASVPFVAWVILAR